MTIVSKGGSSEAVTPGRMVSSKEPIATVLQAVETRVPEVVKAVSAGPHPLLHGEPPWAACRDSLPRQTAVWGARRAFWEAALNSSWSPGGHLRGDHSNALADEQFHS